MSESGGSNSMNAADPLSRESWQRMGTQSSYFPSGREALQRVFGTNFTSRIVGDMEGDEMLKVTWLSATLFFVVGGYWLLRSLKDPIISTIDGVEYIPQAKIASLFVVFALVIVYNKLLDVYPKHHLFYMMGCAYGVIFAVIALALMHPTIGLANTQADPSRLLGWISYVTIESFGSMVVQCYWALVNASVDVNFAKKNFGIIVAGAQIGSILGPTLATQVEYIGIASLYFIGALVMFMMVGAMYLYISKFVPEGAMEKTSEPVVESKTPKKDQGIMEGFYLFYEHDYVKGIFAVSSLYMIQVTVVDYMMKVLAKERYALMFPNDPQAALSAFASFMGYFGQITNSISFLFSLFGTGMIIKHFGLTWTLIAFPVLLLGCTVLVFTMPNLWIVFFVMLIMKGMSYALNNPTKEILYQATSSSIKFKCKSWIDTFGQRGSKAAGSIVTNAFATSIVDLANYGSAVGLVISVLLIWVSNYMGKEFEALSERGEKVGDPSASLAAQLAAMQNQKEDTSCTIDEEGQNNNEMRGKASAQDQQGNS
jgi:AAA family ATP:ADP antiporter